MKQENLKLYQLKQHWEKKRKEYQTISIIQFSIFLTILLLLTYTINSQVESILTSISTQQTLNLITLILGILITIYIANKVLQSAYKNLDKKETAYQKRTIILSYLSLKENNQAINDEQLIQEFEQELAKI